MKSIFDPNEKFKKKIALFLTIIIIVLPFIFVYIKYQIQQSYMKELENKYIIDTSIKDKSNFVKLNFSDIRKMKISNNKKYLYVYSHDRGGLAILDIEDINNIKLLSSYLLPNIKENYVVDMDMVETKDGKNLYIVSPNIGFYSFDISNPKDIKIKKVEKIKKALKISLSNDETKAYIRSDIGMFILDLSSKIPTVSGTYESHSSIAMPQKNGRDAYPIDLGDIVTFSDKYIFLLDIKGLHLLDVSDEKNIKPISHFGTLGKGRELILAPNKLRLYIKSISNNIESYDISDLNNIKSLGGYTSTKEYINSAKITRSGTKLILASKNTGKDNSPNIDIVDLSYSLDPTLIQKYKTKRYFYAFELSPDEKYIFLALSNENKYKHENYIIIRKISLEK